MNKNIKKIILILLLSYGQVFSLPAMNMAIPVSHIYSSGKLKTGERIKTRKGTITKLIEKEKRPGTEPVYNLEIYRDHNFYVGEQGLLVPNSYILNAIKPRLKKLLPDDESFERIVKLYEGNVDLEKALKGTVEQLELYGLSKQNNLKLFEDKDFIIIFPLRENGLKTIPDTWWNNPQGLEDLWLKVFKRSDISLSKQQLIDRKINTIQSKITQINTNQSNSIDEIAVVLGQANVTEPYISALNQSNNIHFIEDNKWASWYIEEKLVRMKDYRLNMIQGVETARRMESLNIIVNGKHIKGSVYFNLTDYDIQRSITAIYSNPNNFINAVPPIIPAQIASNPKAIIGVTDMELSNIVRNQEWFDITHFFIIENNIPKLLTKSEVEERFGIKCISHLIGK